MVRFLATPAVPAEIERQLLDARRRTLDLVRDLDDEQLLGPHLPIVNPLLWEIGHVAWFQERWVSRAARGAPPLREDGDRLWDSSAVAHDTRWDLPLPNRAGTLAYMQAVLERSLAGVGDVHRPEIAYYYRLALLHEDMHDEAFTYTRQTLGYPAPALAAPGWEQAPAETAADLRPSFAAIPGGVFEMGSGRDEHFVFDN
jgi:iron(II)-dependent oxidoreductase